MMWFFKKISEDDKVVNIGYSYLEDTCDGLIIYNKKTHEKTLSKVYLVKNYDEDFSLYVGKKAFRFLDRLIANNMIKNTPIQIATG